MDDGTNGIYIYIYIFMVDLKINYLVNLSSMGELIMEGIYVYTYIIYIYR